MDDRLLARYREYARTEEAYAVLFVKTHLVQAKGHWVDIVGFRRYEMSPDNLHFRFVVGGIVANLCRGAALAISADCLDSLVLTGRRCPTFVRQDERLARRLLGGLI